MEYIFNIINNEKNKNVEKNLGIFLLFGLYFMSSGEKLFNFKKTYDGIVKKGLPVPLLATIFAISSQIIGIFLVLNYELKFNFFKENKVNFIGKYVGKYLLIVFTILATYYYHNMFIDKTQTIHFMKNVSIIGGLLLI